MSRVKSYSSLLFVIFCALVCVINAAQAAAKRFKGFIGGNRVEMTLRRDAEQLDGSYFYTKVGGANPLSLRGRINASGKFVMQEFDANGKQTGEFSGTWKEETNEPSATLEGEWKKPNAKEPQYFIASEQMISFTNNTQVNTKQFKESFKTKRLEVTAEYPELTGGGASDADFNNTVRARIAKNTAAFKKENLALTGEDLKMLLPKGMNAYIAVYYDIVYADDDLISVNFLTDSFAGGAHPNQNYFTVTYDLKNNRELKLADLFKPGAKYLELLSAYAIKDLQNRKIPDGNENAGLAQDGFKDGALPTADNYARWNITRKGLMFTFDPYQVGAYAFGPQTVIVPYQQLKEIARPDGVLAKTVKSE